MAQPPDLADIFQWEVRSWSRAYPLWRKHLKAGEGVLQQALALGERDGGLSLMLAHHGYLTICSDLHGPTEQARVLHQRAGVQGRMTYAPIDALAIAQPDNSFDVVAFKSMIGALGSKARQAQAVREMHRVLKPGGVLLFAENLHGSPLHVRLRKRYVAWDHYWRYLDPVADRDLFAPFGTVDDATTGFVANLGRTAGQRDLLARLDGVVLPLVPVRWRTIWYGAAIKG